MTLMYVAVDSSIYPSIKLYLSMYLSIYLSVCLSIYLSIYIYMWIYIYIWIHIYILYIFIYIYHYISTIQLHQFHSRWIIPRPQTWSYPVLAEVLSPPACPQPWSPTPRATGYPLGNPGLKPSGPSVWGIVWDTLVQKDVNPPKWMLSDLPHILLKQTMTFEQFANQSTGGW
jgi:hypothetical protein